MGLGVAAAVAGIVGGLATAGTAVASAVRKPKGPKLPEVQRPKTIGEDTTLKPGQRANLINTSPQGVLEPGNTSRTRLLGG